MTIPNIKNLIPAFDNATEAEGIIKISNIDKNGVLIKNSKAAEYWHSDGNFWPGDKKNLWNFMHMKIIPPVGGDTAFADGQLAVKIIKKEKPAFYKTLKKIEVVVDAKNIETVPEYIVSYFEVTLTTHKVTSKSHRNYFVITF